MKAKLITRCQCERIIETQLPRPHQIRVVLPPDIRPYALLRANDDLSPPDIRVFELTDDEDKGMPIYREVKN